MLCIEYSREDIRITEESFAPCHIELRIEIGDATHGLDFSSRIVLDVEAVQNGTANALAQHLENVEAAVAQQKQRLNPLSDPQRQQLARIALDIQNPDLVALPWEAAIETRLRSSIRLLEVDWVIVRSSRVRPS